MKLKIFIYLTVFLKGFGWQADAQTNAALVAAAPHVWTFVSTVKTFTADYVTSNDKTVYVRNSGTNYALLLSEYPPQYALRYPPG